MNRFTNTVLLIAMSIVTATTAHISSALNLSAQQAAPTTSAATTSSATKIRLTLDEAIRIGMGYSKTLHTSEMRVLAAEARVGESGAAMLPSLALSASYARLSDIPANKRPNFANLISIPTIGIDQTKIDRDLISDRNVQNALKAIGQGFTVGSSSSGGGSGSEGGANPFNVILDNYTAQASLAYPVFSGFRLEAAKAAAEYNAQAASQDLVKDRIETEFTIKSTYWTLYKARQLQTLTKETIEQVTARLSDAQNLLKNGLLTTNDVLRLQLQLSNAKITNIDANNAAQLSALSLNNTLGLPLGTEVELASTIDYKPAVLSDYEKAIQRALDSRAEVSSTQLRIKAGEEGVRAAKGGYLPSLGISGNFLYANPNQRFFGSNTWEATWQLAAQLSWTVWNWNTTGYQVAQAEAQVAQAEDGLSMLRDGIKLEVTQNYLTLQQSREKIAVAQQGIEQANENYRITNEKFKKGLALTSDLTDAETFQLQAKVNYVSSVVDYEIAQARLQKSIGDAPIVTGK